MTASTVPKGPLTDLVGNTVPMRWVTDVDVRIRWVGLGVPVRGFEKALADAEKDGLIEVRPASESKLNEPGDIDLPTSTEARSKMRQVRRIFKTDQEKQREWHAPPAITLSAARADYARRHGIRTPPPPPPDPTKVALRDAQEEIASLKEQVEALTARLDEAAPSDGGLLKRFRH